MDLQAVAQKLLGGEFDIGLLDQVVGAAYDPVSPHRAQANKALMQLQESPDLWQKADAIIEQSSNPNSRFFGLQVLDDAIKTRCVKFPLFDPLFFFFLRLKILPLEAKHFAFHVTCLF
jgi:exportin-1